MKKTALWFFPLLILFACTVQPPFEDLEIVDHIKLKNSPEYLEFASNGDAWVGSGMGVKVFDEELNVNFIDLFDYNTGAFARNLCLDNQDRLWFDDDRQLKYYENGEVTEFYSPDTIGWEGYIRSFAIDSQDRIWMIYLSFEPYTYDSPKCHIILHDHDNIQIFDRGNTGILSNALSLIKVDSDNNIWVAASDSLFKYDGTDWTCYDSDDFGFQVKSISDFVIDQSGNIYAAINSLSLYKANNLMIYNPERTLVYNIPEAGNPSLFLDSDNLLWYADGSSFITFDGNVFRDIDYDHPPRLIRQAPNGDIWSVTDEGIYIYRKN